MLIVFVIIYIVKKKEKRNQSLFSLGEETAMDCKALTGDFNWLEGSLSFLPWCLKRTLERCLC